MSEWKRDAERIVSELKAAIILAGGIEFKDEALRDMTFGDLIDLIYPNRIRLNVKMSLPQEKQGILI